MIPTPLLVSLASQREGVPSALVPRRFKQQGMFNEGIAPRWFFIQLVVKLARTMKNGEFSSISRRNLTNLHKCLRICEETKYNPGIIPFFVGIY